MLPLQKGDALSTYADVSELVKAVDYKPSTQVQTGVNKFVEWYRDYYGVQSIMKFGVIDKSLKTPLLYEIKNDVS